MLSPCASLAPEMGPRDIHDPHDPENEETPLELPSEDWQPQIPPPDLDPPPEEIDPPSDDDKA